MGLGTAVMIYALLRRYGLPGWGATLAAAPVLFDPAQLLLEQLVMADVLAMTLLVGALVLLLNGRLSPWRLATSGLLIGLSTIVRPTVLPLIVLMALYLLFRRAGWRRVAVTLAACALPVVAYAGWFDAAHGSFNLTDSNGLFLWSRTMSFARCSVIKPPPDLRPLCPSAQPGGLANAKTFKRPPPSSYLWDRGTWEWQPPVRQFVPNAAAFTQAKNARAQQFAVRAIMAQPFSYAHVVLHETSLPFRSMGNKWRFPVGKPTNEWYLAPGNFQYATAGVVGYTGSKGAVNQIQRYKYATFMKQPFTNLMGIYQNSHLPSRPGAGTDHPGRAGWPAHSSPPYVGGGAAVDFRRRHHGAADGRPRIYVSIPCPRGSALLHFRGAHFQEARPGARAPGRASTARW